MIVLRLMGGLGNQMSQVAYSLRISKMYDEPVYLDASSYEDYKIRPFSVYKMKLCDKYKSLDTMGPSIKRMHLFQRMYESLHYHFGHNKSFGRLLYRISVFFGHYYSFDSICYDITKVRSRDKDIYGYFLSEGYFRENREELIELFDTQEQYLDNQCLEYFSMINTCICPVAISVRLQDDYVKSEVNNVCTPDYYSRAVKLIKEKFHDAEFFVFADDIDRAKDMKLDISATYLENISDVEGMYLLKQCKHYIISNSSFAWWGAYLGNYPGKIVVAPKCWMNDGRDYSSKYYDNMIPID